MEKLTESFPNIRSRWSTAIQADPFFLWRKLLVAKFRWEECTDTQKFSVADISPFNYHYNHILEAT